MRIVALDLATNTGVAVRQDGGKPECWSEDIGKGRSEEVRFSKVLSLTDTLIREFEPDLIAIEAAIGGPKSSQYLIGLVACVRGCVANRKKKCQMYYLSAIRKHFLGRALTTKDFPGMSKAAAKSQIKKAVMDRCKLLGWECPDHDAADAAALSDYAMAQHRVQVAPGGSLFT